MHETAGGDITFRITDDDKIERMFVELPRRAQEGVLKPLMREGIRDLAEAIRGQAPRDSGLLKAAIGATLVRKYPSALFATAGVRRGFRRAVTLTKKGTLRFRSKRNTQAAEQAQVRNPARYLHIVERGRKAISALQAKVLYSAQLGKFFGRKVAAVEPNPFVERAFQTARESVTQSFCQRAADRIVQEAQRLAR